MDPVPQVEKKKRALGKWGNIVNGKRYEMFGFVLLGKLMYGQ